MQKSEDNAISSRLDYLWDFAIEIFSLLPQYARLQKDHQIPQKYFETGGKAFPQAAVELMVVKYHSLEWKVFLIQRSNDSNDPWQNELHIPGTVLRIDDTEEDIFNRLFLEELKTNPIHTKIAFQFLTNDNLTTSLKKYRSRGTCLHVIHVCIVKHDQEFSTGEFYSMSCPPENLIKHQIEWVEILHGQLLSKH